MSGDDFFGPPEPHEPPRSEPRYRTPPWFGPPEGELAWPDADDGPGWVEIH